MNKYIAIILLAPAFVWADRFQVTDLDTGVVYGPFVYTNGTILNIHTNRLELKRLSTAADELTKRLKTIVIPSIEFRNANIYDVINFLVEASIATDPKGTGANIVLSRISPDPSRATNAPSTITDSEYGIVPDQRPTEPYKSTDSITLSLRRISLYDAISVITELAGLEFIVDERNVVILKDGKAISERK